MLSIMRFVFDIKIMPYRKKQSFVQNDAVQRHPTEREADSDVDHRPHDIDLCLGQRVWPSLTFDLAWPGLVNPFVIGLSGIRCLALSSTCSGNWFLRQCRTLNTFCSNPCLTPNDRQDLPVRDDKDDQRYEEQPDEHEYPVDLSPQRLQVMFKWGNSYKPVMLIVVLVLVFKDSLRTKFKSLSLSLQV